MRLSMSVRGNREGEKWGMYGLKSCRKGEVSGGDNLR